MAASEVGILDPEADKAVVPGYSPAGAGAYAPQPAVGDRALVPGSSESRPTDLRVIVRSVVAAMRITLTNLFRKPVTVHYPDKQRAYPDRYRGLLALAYEKDTGEEACIGCRLCEFVCPPAVIKVEMLKGEKRNYAKSFTLELYACEFCELCVQVCPTDAIIMMKSFDLSTSDRRELLLDKDRLHAIGLQHQASWATGNRLRDMQGPPKMARTEEHAKKEGPATPKPEPAKKAEPAVAMQAEAAKTDEAAAAGAKPAQPATKDEAAPAGGGA